MKGVVFTEFLEMVEETFGYDTVDKIIEQSTLPSEGIYTATGTYDHAEIVQLVSNLSTLTDMEVSALLKAFGRYLFDTFYKNYPVFFKKCDSAFSFLESIDNHIHVEVRKLYPEATLPTFNTQVDDRQMTMEYRSERKMADLAEGLIEKSMEHWEETPYTIHKKSLDDQGEIVLFTIVKQDGA